MRIVFHYTSIPKVGPVQLVGGYPRTGKQKRGSKQGNSLGQKGPEKQFKKIFQDRMDSYSRKV